MREGEVGESGRETAGGGVAGGVSGVLPLADAAHDPLDFYRPDIDPLHPLPPPPKPPDPPPPPEHQQGTYG